MSILIFLAGFIIVWSIWGFLSSRVETTAYTVVKQAHGYEVRRYPAHLVAQTTVLGPYHDALNTGFRIVAGYIFGGNTKKERIPMTAPVTAEQGASEKIAMTAPVRATTEGEAHVISFGMPRSYTLATLPTPTDSRVKLMEVPEEVLAVRRFSWWRTTTRTKKMEAQLLSDLKRDGVQVTGTPTYAGYNAPWTPPWMMRHEVMVEVIQ